MLDLIIIGAGPAGLSACLGACVFPTHTEGGDPGILSSI